MPEMPSRAQAHLASALAAINYERLLSPPIDSVAVAYHALQRARVAGRGYAFSAAPTSPYPNLVGNLVPEMTKISWLAYKYKCNQFVGDVLTQAGFCMPTRRVKGGAEIYEIAERLPVYERHFDRITDLHTVRAGDLLVIDDLSRVGAGSAHVEIITAYSSDGKLFESTGAHVQGVVTKSRAALWRALTYDPLRRGWYKPGMAVYILRPKLRICT